MDRRLYERWAAGEITDEEYRLTLSQTHATMATTEDKTMPDSKSKINYDARTAYKVGIKLNRNTDADLIEMLEAADNKQALIKQALREYGRSNTMIDMKYYKQAVELMDDEIREEMHRERDWETEEEFLREYERRHLEKYGTEFQI